MNQNRSSVSLYNHLPFLVGYGQHDAHCRVAPCTIFHQVFFRSITHHLLLLLNHARFAIYLINSQLPRRSPCKKCSAQAQPSASGCQRSKPSAPHKSYLSSISSPFYRLLDWRWAALTLTTSSEASSPGVRADQGRPILETLMGAEALGPWAVHSPLVSMSTR